MDIQGIITKGVGGLYTVVADGISYQCKARGVFRNKKMTPLIGDMAVITMPKDSELGTIHTIKPRKNQLVRPAVANVDQVIITVAAAQPAFNPGLLDRFLVLVAHEGIPVVICVNKSDVGIVDEAFAPYSQGDYPMVYTSTLERNGLEDLRQHMAGKINVFAGPSGVGKSSLLNALSPSLALETGVLSVKLDRGKHTTRHSEIFELDGQGGFCVDTPGFSSLEIAHIPKQVLGTLFREFGQFSEGCKFSDCLHHQERDCGVKAAVGQGISAPRYNSYIKMLQGL